MKIFIIVLAILLYYLYPTIQHLAILSGGYSSKTVCSNYFLSGRDQSLLKNELSELFGAVHSQINPEEKYVISYLFVGLDISNFLGIPTPIAVYLGPSFGCRLTHKPVKESLEMIAAFEFIGHNITIESNEIDSTPTTKDEKEEATSQCVQRIIDAEFTEEAFSKNNTRATVVSLNGVVIGEGYQKALGVNKDTKLLGWSMTKSLHAAIVGVAVEQGIISLDEPAKLKYVDPAQQDIGEKAITIRDLIEMKDVLAFEENYKINQDVTQMLYVAENAAKFASQKKTRSEKKGKKAKTIDKSWYYSSGISNVLAVELRDRFPTWDEYLAFPHSQLFDQIGAPSFALEMDTSGTFTASSYSYATARDWARLGELFLREGQWEGKRILSKKFVRFVRGATSGSGGHYGGSFWTNPSQVSVSAYNELAWDHPDKNRKAWLTTALPSDAYFMGGYLGQFVMIIPSKNLVVSRLGFTKETSIERGDWSPARFFGGIVDCLL